MAVVVVVVVVVEEEASASAAAAGFAFFFLRFLSIGVPPLSLSAPPVAAAYSEPGIVVGGCVELRRWEELVVGKR